MTCTKSKRLLEIKNRLERVERLMLELQRMSVYVEENRAKAKAKLVVIEGDRTECSETNS